MVALSVWLRSNEISRRLEAQKSACASRFAQENLFIFFERKKEETTASKYSFDENSRISLRIGEHLRERGKEMSLMLLLQKEENFPLHFESSRVQYLRVEKKMYRSIFRRQINNERIYRKSWTLLLFRFDMNGGY